MDDYSLSSLSESKNEWCSRLVNVLTPHLIQGLKSIFKEAWDLCKDNRDKYLMTFQTFLSRVPKWNTTIVENERKRIVEASGCNYLEELITCVHVIHLKALTCVRVGQKQKKVDIDIPPLDVFLHKVYANIARRVYANIYLFEVNIAPLQVQKHNWVLETIVKECLLNTVRENVPVESILRAYMDTTEENDVEVVEEIEKVPLTPEEEQALADQQKAAEAALRAASASSTKDGSGDDAAAKDGDNSEEGSAAKKPAISFNDIDSAIDEKGHQFVETKPKTDERLDQIMEEAHNRRKMEAAADNDDDDGGGGDLLQIGEDIALDFGDINDLSSPSTKSSSTSSKSGGGGGADLSLNDIMDVEVIP
jgi:hypothetical protein